VSAFDRPTPGRSPAQDRPAAPDPLPAPVTDTHCHLDITRDGSPSDWGLARQALADAAAVNVTRIMQVGTNLTGSAWAVEAAQRFDNVVAAVALHPNEAPRLAGEDALDDALNEIDRLAGSSDRVRAVGETGLDYFRTGPDGRAAQEYSFRAHIELAKRHGKALVIHDRDAHADVLRVLDDAGPPERVVFHCYSGDAEMAHYCVERGWFLSFAGPVTFKNGADLRAALKATPLGHVLVETDSPFLTPHPHRGQPNGPYLMPHTVRTIAEVLERELGVVCEALQNATNSALGMW
jgi:TatD DNase family protein